MICMSGVCIFVRTLSGGHTKGHNQDSFLLPTLCREWNRSATEEPEAEMEMETRGTFDVFEALAPSLVGNDRGKPLCRVRFFEVWKQKMKHLKVLFKDCVCF